MKNTNLPLKEAKLKIGAIIIELDKLVDDAERFKKLSHVELFRVRYADTMAMILEKQEQLKLAEAEKTACYKNHQWTYGDVLSAYLVYRKHRHNSAESVRACEEHGEALGMGFDSFHMKVCAFWSFENSDGSWTLCETGRLIFKDFEASGTDEIATHAAAAE